MTIRYEDKMNHRTIKALRRIKRYKRTTWEAVPAEKYFIRISALEEAERANPYRMQYEWLAAEHAYRYHFRVSCAWIRRLDTMRQYRRIK